MKKGDVVKVVFWDHYETNDMELDREPKPLTVFGEYYGTRNGFVLVRTVVVPEDFEPPWNNVIAIYKGAIKEMVLMKEVIGEHEE